MSKMKMMVTGGAGFIGSHLAEALLAAGHEVAIVDNLRTGKKENIPAQAEFIELDICAEEMAGVFEKGKFDAVFHLAAQNDVRTSVARPEFDAQVNILGSLNLLQNCVKTKVGRFIFASTGGAIYGEVEHPPADETHPIRPEAPYGITKYTVEHYMRYFTTIYGLQTRPLRFANVYGPRQDPHGEAGVVAIFCGLMLAGKRPKIFGDGEQLRDYVYVGDVVAAFLRALEAPGEAVNIGTGVGTSVNQIYHGLAALLNYPEPPEYAPKRPGEIQCSYLAWGRANKELGWQPKVSFDQGLALTAEWFSPNRSYSG
jgi:UDP-glucose 4-epimerase